MVETAMPVNSAARRTHSASSLACPGVAVLSLESSVTGKGSWVGLKVDCANCSTLLEMESPTIFEREKLAFQDSNIPETERILIEEARDKVNRVHAQIQPTAVLELPPLLR